MVNMLIKTFVLKRVLFRYFAEDKTWTMKFENHKEDFIYFKVFNHQW